MPMPASAASTRLYRALLSDVAAPAVSALVAIVKEADAMSGIVLDCPCAVTVISVGAAAAAGAASSAKRAVRLSMRVIGPPMLDPSPPGKETCSHARGSDRRSLRRGYRPLHRAGLAGSRRRHPRRDRRG